MKLYAIKHIPSGKYFANQFCENKEYHTHFSRNNFQVYTDYEVVDINLLYLKQYVDENGIFIGLERYKIHRNDFEIITIKDENFTMDKFEIVPKA